MAYELKELEGIVSGQRQEAQAMEKDVKWLKDNIQVRLIEPKVDRDAMRKRW